MKTLPEIVAFLEACLPFDDLQLQISWQSSSLLVIFDLSPLAELTFDSLSETLLQKLVGVSLPNLNTLLLQGRHWGDSKILWQKEVSLPLERQMSEPASATRLMPIVQKRYRNVMEELVADEVAQHWEALEDAYLKETFNTNQAIAYALNRLQPMYATTEAGWLSLRNYAANNRDIIKRVVSQAFVVVQATPRPTSDNLYRNQPRTSAQILARLTKLMGKNNLRWRDLPDTLQRKIDKQHKYRRQSTGYEIRSYLKRSKLRELTVSNDHLYLVEFGMVTTDWFKVYMSAAINDYLNVLEQVVHDTIALQDTNGQQLDLDEIIAYALNRLPPMYATSETGIEQLRQMALQQMQDRINEVVKQAIAHITDHPRPALQPLPFAIFDRELEFALKEVRQMLDRTDISWENLDQILYEEFKQRDITIPHGYQ